MNFINKLFRKYDQKSAIVNPEEFFWTENFRHNWKNIRKEFLSFNDNYIIPKHKQINEYVASCEKKSKWNTLYLRIYNKNTKIADFFPLTMKLVNTCPCTLAMFSILEPGAILEPHYGIYGGVLRYHLGLIVPEQKEKCFINVDGKVLWWSEGLDIMFDDTYLHHVENNTNQPRVVLFLDIKKNFKNPMINILNNLFLNFVKSNDILKDTIDNVNILTKKVESITI